ncbi:hypothetical protein [Brucella intermedia]
MPSKELIALAANAMEERRKELIAQPLSRIYPQLAEAAVNAVREALSEADIAMINTAEAYAYRGSKGYTGLWRAMLNASALGEQSE